jgi:hypothetical protein
MRAAVMRIGDARNQVLSTRVAAADDATCPRRPPRFQSQGRHSPYARRRSAATSRRGNHLMVLLHARRMLGNVLTEDDLRDAERIRRDRVSLSTVTTPPRNSAPTT